MLPFSRVAGLRCNTGGIHTRQGHRTKKRLVNVGATLVAIAVALGFFDGAHLLLDLLQHGSWTPGSYHHPILLGIELFTGTVLGAMTLVCLAGIFHPRFRGGRRAVTGALTVFGLGAVSSLWLPLIHLNEVDVSPAGFRQDHFAISTRQTLKFYAPGPEPVTVCLGRSGQCVAGPTVLGAPSLTLRQGRLVNVHFPSEGTYGLTIAGSTANATVAAAVPECEANPDSAACLNEDTSQYGG